MSAIVQNVCKLSQNIFSNFLSKNQTKLDESHITTLKKIFSQVTLNDIYFNINEVNSSNHDNKFLAPITYTSLFENQFFSLTVFGFRRKTSVIPLHDHPGMYGFIKCVHGCVAIKSYTVLNYLDAPSEIINKVSTLERNCLVPSLYLGEEIISSDNCLVGTVTPTERNIHEVKPLTNVAVMTDIIAPPYTDFTDSHFYKIVDTVFDARLNKNITWLLKTLHCNEYYCDTLIYRGPDIIV